MHCSPTPTSKHSTYFQLATIGSNGRTANRTVVFRGFQENSDKIQINTDCRSRKIEDLKHCPFAEMCWYFTESWEQFRINGTVDVIDGSNPDPMKLQHDYINFQLKICDGWTSFKWLDLFKALTAVITMQQREKAWFASSPKSRLQYLGPNPGLPSISEHSSQENSLDPSSGPVGALLVVDPDQVDYLNLKSNERIAFTSIQDTNGEKLWNSEGVDP